MIKVLVDLAKHTPFLKDHIYQTSRERSRGMYTKIKDYLRKKDKILDIGAGMCTLAEILDEKGYRVTSSDVEDFSFVDDIKPIVYDGENMPLEDNEFDMSLLVTVLHHTKNPEKILREAKRVSKRIVIVEEIYTTSFQKYATYLMDNVTNFEIFVNPHSNKNDEAWKATFKELGLKLKDTKYETFWKLFLSTTYYLEK